MQMKIKEWNHADRPREKLIRMGAGVLSEAELLAVLMGSGTAGINCVDWSRSILAQTGGLIALLNSSPDELIHLDGVGPARVSQICAVREIVTRFVRAQVPSRLTVRDPEALAEYLRAALGSQKREVFRAVYLNKKLEIIEERDLFIGTIDETPVYPREIIARALACHATAVILAHNHPSGRLQPSPEDLRVTEKVISACSLVGVKVLDHVIVGANGYFSFSNEGLLAEFKTEDAGTKSP